MREQHQTLYCQCYFTIYLTTFVQAGVIKNNYFEFTEISIYSLKGKSRRYL